MTLSLLRKQKGAVAIEFALVFVISFAVFYGLVSYSLPLLLMQSFNEVLTVSANYPTIKLNQVLPFLLLPGVGTVPDLPVTLNAKSSLQF